VLITPTLGTEALYVLALQPTCMALIAAGNTQRQRLLACVLQHFFLPWLPCMLHDTTDEHFLIPLHYPLAEDDIQMIQQHAVTFLLFSFDFEH